MQDLTDPILPEPPDDKEAPAESEEGETSDLEEPTNAEGLLKAALSKAYWWDLKHEPEVRKSTLNKKVLTARKKARKRPPGQGNEDSAPLISSGNISIRLA